jgi:predicted ATPase/class 3 adenylate cyclase
MPFGFEYVEAALGRVWCTGLNGPWGMPMAEFPTGTVTFVFTDLEGSTRLWDEHPEAMRVALARHDEILRGAVEDRGGRVVKSTGDGCMAAFGTAMDALAAAVEGQRALNAERWAETGPLRVRMGLHTGTAESREGDYFGGVLNRAARLTNVAHGGQVVVSQATADLARDALPDDCELVDLGEHRLRDLSRAERVYQVAANGLKRNFARLRSVEAFPGNLPAQVTSFVGRVDEIATVAEALREARLVTLTGVGGVGKTRLAIQAAAEVLPEYPDGAWLCELAAAGDPDAMVQVVAAALGVQAYPAVPLDTGVRAFLRDRRVLVALDNCEHVLDAVSRLAEGVMRECPGVRILATSREPLDIGGERVVRVGSLPLRDPVTGGEEGGESDAVRLFVERASSAEPDFGVDDTNARVVEDICRRLDGIPLAIELAAARVVAMSPAEIRGLLDERFGLLTGGRRTAVERHQTLRAAVDWSYALLSPTEQVVFARLGVFPSSFDAAAAWAVAGGAGVEGWDVVDALTGLVNKSMVNTAGSASGATRYQLLETMRQYARERLDESGEADRCRRAHAAHYEEIVARYSQAMLTGQQLPEMRGALRVELDNLRAAVTWALDSDALGDGDVALRIAGALPGVGPTERRAVGLIVHADRLLERAEASSSELRAGILAGMASDALQLRGDPVAAEDLARRALADGPTNPGVVAMAYSALSLCAAIAGDSERQLEILAEGQRALVELGGGTAHNSAFWEMQIARAESRRGDPNAARAHATEAVRLAREAEFPFRLAQTLTIWADLSRYDDPDAAEAALAEAAHVAPEALPVDLRGRTFLLQAQLRAQQGDARGAVALLHQALVVWGSEVPTLYVESAVRRAAKILADVDETRPAAVCAGAATTGPLTNRLGPRAREELDQTIQHLRTTLGDDVYDTEAARGAAMSSDDTLRFLRDTVDSLIDTSHD